jgi:hypothetical protein
MRGLIIAITVAWLSITAHVNAQECVDKCRVRSGEPFVVFTEAQPDATGYRLKINGIEQFMYPILVNGDVEFQFQTGLARGDYAFVIDVVRSSDTVSTLPGALRVMPGRAFQ